jgi:hypothetical protein
MEKSMDILNMAGTVLFSAAASTIKELVLAAVRAGANLYGANLRGANLYGANLCGADLCGADLYGADLCRANLYGANLRGANLYGANLRGANLYGANLCGADLYGADLCRANLYGANLRGANLYGANLRGANLYGANLRGADLYGANLRGADLYGANLYGAKNAELAIARLQFIPEEGPFIGWKKCKDGVLVKLMIPTEAKRSHGTERKCRASEVIVMEVIGAEVGISMHDGKTEYRAGESVKPESFSEDRWEVCAPGIHFYLTKLEAQKHS